MPEQQTTEQRLSQQEKEIVQLRNDLSDLAERIAILKEQQESASNIDRALLHRVDAFGSELRRFEGETRRSFEAVRSDISEVKADVSGVKADTNGIKAELQIVQENVAILVGVARDHKKGIEELSAGQQQILTILLGEQRRDD